MATDRTLLGTVPLFRPELLTARREATLGALLLVQPISTKLLTLGAVAVAAGLILVSFVGEYTRKASVTGFLVPTQGLIKIYSRETGTIVEKHVVEGQHVSKGDILFLVSMERGSRETPEAQAAAMARLRERRASLESDLQQQARIADNDAVALQQQIDAKELEIDQIGQELTTQRQRVENAHTQSLRYQQLLARSLASAEIAEGKQSELLDQQSRLQSLTRDQINATNQLGTLRALLAEVALKAKTGRAAIERNISSLEQELTEYESRLTFVVTAPADGTATAVLTTQALTVTPSQVLLSLLPRGAMLEAHLFVPSDSIGFVAAGQSVALRYQAFPYQRFGSYMGRVSEISRTLILPNETTLPFPLAQSAYRVTVALDAQAVAAYGQPLPLQSGMLLDASIWLDRRKLYQWLLDPIYSVLGRV